MTTLILSLPNFQHAINHCEYLEHKLEGNILISHWTYYFHVNHDFPIWYNILWRYTVTFIHVAVTFISIQNTLHCTYIYRLHLTKTWRLDIRWLHDKARYQGPRLQCFFTFTERKQFTCKLSTRLQDPGSFLVQDVDTKIDFFFK